MTADDIQTPIKAALDQFAPTDKEQKGVWNKCMWAVSKQINTLVNQEIKAKTAVQKESAASENISKQIRAFMENPMSDEEEAKALRAIYHMNLSSGELSPQLLDKLDKIIGVGTGKDEEIQIVDFKKAFPSYEEAIRICSKPMPEINETT